MQVKDVMYKRLYTVAASTSITKAAQMMAKKNVGSLLVEKNRKIIGIVTDRDFTRKIIAAREDSTTCQVADIMSAPLIMINADAGIVEAGKLMTKYNIKRLGVSQKRKVVGVVSTSIIGKHMEAIIKDAFVEAAEEE